MMTLKVTKNQDFNIFQKQPPSFLRVNRAPNNVDKKTTEKTCRQKKCDTRIAGDNTSNLTCLLCGFNN